MCIRRGNSSAQQPVFFSEVSYLAGFFSPDSKLYKFMSRLTDVVKLNLMWLLFSLPIVTIGSSTIAAFDITLKMAEDNEGHIARGFIKAFKANWKQGIPMTFITLFCLWAVYLDFEIFNVISKDPNAENGWIFLAVGVVAAYVFTCSLLYVYPLLARYENTIFNSLRNSFRITMRYFLRSLVLVVIIALELIVFFFWSEKMWIIGALMGPVCIFFTISGPAMAIFRELEKEPGTVAENDGVRKSDDDNEQEPEE